MLTTDSNWLLLILKKIYETDKNPCASSYGLLTFCNHLSDKALFSIVCNEFVNIALLFSLYTPIPFVIMK